MLYMQSSKQGKWETVKSKADDKKKREGKKQQDAQTRDRLGVAVDPTAAALAAFDRSFAEKKEAAKQPKGYKGAFADLEDEAPPAVLQDDAGDSSGADEEPAASSSNGPSAAPKQPKQPKQPKKPKQSVSMVAAGLDVSGLLIWMAEAQERYSSNEAAQLEALSDKLLGAFKEATFDLAKTVNSKGLQAASELPLSELPNPLQNALASFIASVSEPALVQVLVALVAAVVAEAAAGNKGQPSKGKAGLFVMLAVMLRTRPQALVQAAPELRLLGRQLTSSDKLPLLLWVINQAALADPAVGVAVWVRLLLPQLLGVLELPSAGGANKAGKGASSAGGDTAQLLVPLDVSAQSTALGYLAGLLDQLGVGAGGAASSGGDITRGDGSLEPTVPGAAVEVLSRLVAGKAWATRPAGPAAASTVNGAAAAAGESKKAAAARAAAADGFGPLLPGLTALAAVSSCSSQYSEWLVLALESASMTEAEPETPDALVLRSASNVVACLCGNEACFAMWESKHKGSLRGSARILAALVQQPKLLGPLQQQRVSKEAFRGLLAALPARHRTFLATGKGWQGACARVAQDACGKLPRKLGRSGWNGSSKGAGGSSGGVSPVIAVLGLSSVVVGVVVMSGIYRREVAGVVAAYAGKAQAEQLDVQVLAPIESLVQQGLAAAEPYLQQLQEAAGPAWEKVGPLVQQAREQVLEPALADAQKAIGSLVEQLQDIAAKAKQA